MMSHYQSLKSLKAMGWMMLYGACAPWRVAKKKYACTQFGARGKYNILCPIHEA
jgi:membrane protein CcdC involved in cytochrome C biogenesis